MDTNASFMRLENKADFLASLADIEGDVQEAVIDALKAGGKDITKGLKDAFPVAQTIADMSREDIKGFIISAPGSLPMVQTGELRDSIFSKIMPLMLGEPIALKISTYSAAFYGHILEFGSTKMAARPWFFSGIARLVPSLKGGLVSMLEKVIVRRNGMRGKYIRRGRMNSAIANMEAQKDSAKLQDFIES